MLTLDEFQRLALDVPFQIGGRSYAGWDCWGLVYCAYRDVFDIVIPSLAADYEPDVSYSELMQLVDEQRNGWEPLETPETGAVGLYRVGKYHSHVALVLPRARMLHCERGTGSICEPLSNLVWRGRNVGYFRRRENHGGASSLPG